MKTQVADVAPVTMTAGKVLTIKMMIVAVFSFLVCRATVLGTMSPFGIAFTAAMPMQYAWVTFIGSILGYSVLGFSPDNLLYLITLTVVMLFKFMLRKNRYKESAIMLSTMVLFSALFVNILGGFVAGFNFVEMLMRICESALVAGITCVFSYAIGAFLSEKKLKLYNKIELGSLSLLVMVGIIALMDINIGAVRVGIIVGIMLLYIMVYKLGAVGGAMSAIALGVAFNLYSVNFIELSALLILAAVASGLFKPLGRIMQVGVFLAVSVFSMFILGVSIGLLYHIIEILIASGGYLILKKNQLEMFNLYDDDQELNQNLKTNIENRLDFAAYTISDLQESLTKVSKTLREAIPNDIISIYQKTIVSSCTACTMRSECWNDAYENTVDAFLKLTQKLKRGENLEMNDIDETSLASCRKKSGMLTRLTNNYNDFVNAEHEKRRIEDMRGLAVEQLAGVSQMLWEVSDEIGNIERNDNDAATLVREIFTEFAAEPTCVYCSINKYDRMEIDIYTLSNVNFDANELTSMLTQDLKREFAQPCISQIENKVRISFYEQANFTVEFGACQISGVSDAQTVESEEVCGDSYEYFIDSKGNAFMILSDGMGSGKRAALDSAITCSMVLKLIKAGFGLDSIIKLVNSSLQAKSADESLSTIDITKIDLYSGEATFYKAGSAPSFVTLSGIVGEVTTNSLPVGILGGVEFDKSKLLINVGDTIVVLSDGLLALPNDLLRKIIRIGDELSAKDLACKLCEVVVRECEGKGHDDLTVLVAKIGNGVQ